MRTRFIYQVTADLYDSVVKHHEAGVSNYSEKVEISPGAFRYYIAINRVESGVFCAMHVLNLPNSVYHAQLSFKYSSQEFARPTKISLRLIDETRLILETARHSVIMNLIPMVHVDVFLQYVAHTLHLSSTGESMEVVRSFLKEFYSQNILLPRWLGPPSKADEVGLYYYLQGHLFPFASVKAWFIKACPITATMTYPVAVALWPHMVSTYRYSDKVWEVIPYADDYMLPGGTPLITGPALIKKLSALDDNICHKRPEPASELEFSSSYSSSSSLQYEESEDEDDEDYTGMPPLEQGEPWY